MNVIKNIASNFYGLIYVCNNRYEIEFMNENLINLLGRNAIGELCYKALRGINEVCPSCPREKALRGEVVCSEVRSPLNNRLYYTVSSPHFIDDDNVLQVTISVDITEQNMVEKAFGSEMCIEHTVNKNLKNGNKVGIS